MTKADLASKLSRTLGISSSEAETIVSTIYLSILGSVQAGQTVDIRGFGRFTMRLNRGSPPARVPHFRPSRRLKQFVRSHSGSWAEAAR
jgi:nucleoid DNA-binding protein